MSLSLEHAIEIGAKLPNGAEVLDSAPMPNRIDQHWLSVVLCYSPVTDEYVTWNCRNDDRVCESGHYFDELFAARLDFHKRAAGV